MEDPFTLPSRGELFRRTSPDGEVKQETNVNPEPASSTSPLRDLPLDPPPGLGPPLPSSSDPPAGTTTCKREAVDQSSDRLVRQRLPDPHREPRALSPPEANEGPTTKQARKVAALLQGDSTLTPVPTVITKKGQSIDLAVNEETTQLDEPILVDMYHYGHLDEKKLKVGLQKEMNAMINFDVYTEVDKDTLSSDVLQNAIETRFECKKQRR